MESALFQVGMKIRSPSCRNTPPLAMLKRCSFHAPRTKFVLVVPFFTTFLLRCKEFFRFTTGYKIIASMTLNVDLNNANGCPVYESTQTRWSNTMRWYCPAFHQTSTQRSDAIADPQANEAGTSPFATQVANKSVSLNSRATASELCRERQRGMRELKGRERAVKRERQRERHE